MYSYVNGIGVLGPELPDWETTRAILLGNHAYPETGTIPDPTPSCLQPNELRRSSAVVRWALHVAQEAIEHSQLKAQDVATVFSTSGGETDILHKICLALTNHDAAVSPTLFHHSVHNAAAGYWSIAVQSQQPSTSLSCYDSSFCGGLLETSVLCRTNNIPVLLVAYDLPPPPPLYSARPIVASFALALMLTPHPSQNSLCKLTVQFCERESSGTSTMANTHLEALRTGNPAARSLPLLAGIARGNSRTLLEYLDDQCLAITVDSCNP